MDKSTEKKAVPGQRLSTSGRQSFRQRLVKSLRRDYWLYIVILPMLIWYLVFHYIPMGGIVVAFKRYNGVKTIWESRWVGLKWFEDFFTSPYAGTVIKNTLAISLYSLGTFPLAIILALFFNELRSAKFKKVAQTVMYAPHFISTVVLVSMLQLFFSPQYGFINTIIKALGGQTYSFMIEPKAFPHMYVWSGVWQNLGWNCIIYIAALAGVDPGLHEAARIDGATRIQRIFHINLPAIMPTVIITLIMAVGSIMAVSTDKVLLMKNDLNISTSEVIGTYVYERGLISGEFGYATAVGLFTNVVNLILLLTVNRFSRQVSETSLF